MHPMPVDSASMSCQDVGDKALAAVPFYRHGQRQPEIMIVEHLCVRKGEKVRRRGTSRSSNK